MSNTTSVSEKRTYISPPENTPPKKITHKITQGVNSLKILTSQENGETSSTIRVLFQPVFGFIGCFSHFRKISGGSSPAWDVSGGRVSPEHISQIERRKKRLHSLEV